MASYRMQVRGEGKDLSSIPPAQIPLSGLLLQAAGHNTYAQFYFRWFINLFLMFLWVQSSPVQSTSVQWLVTPVLEQGEVSSHR